VTAAPSAAFRRHHDIEAPQVDSTRFRQAWRVATRLDALHRDGALTAGEYQAAVEYRAAWERVLTATHGNAALGVRVSGGGGDGGADRLAAVADTITKLRQTDAAIGPLATWLCFACIVHDGTWAEAGRLLHRDPHTARAWTVLAIAGLALAWGGGRRRRSPRPVVQGGQRLDGL
jgi:hypothetical protein